MTISSISQLRVQGLHGQFNVLLNLNTALNVIYGKNGRGKTTILHILANALELDFKRFQHLAFKSIDIETHQGGAIRITKGTHGPHQVIQVEVDGRETTPIVGDQTLSEAEEQGVRDVLGDRSLYLPAFRSILEGMGSDSFNYSPRDPDQQRAYEGVLKSESALTRSRNVAGLGFNPRRNEQDAATAAKTTLCRQWFGNFIPVVRYPSLTDVQRRLFIELRDAQVQMTAVEQSVLSESFIRVFEAIAGTQPYAATRSTTELLQDVAEALKTIKSRREGDDVYTQIFNAVTQIERGPDLNEQTTNRVLTLYADLLSRRSTQEEELFRKIGDFERSVNKFLDGKEIKINNSSVAHRGLGAVIQTSSGRQISALSSLSSGERQVLTMIFCASRMAENRGIFLVDEPELSLHVDWQRDILSEVMRQAGGRQVIACTHSPEVGADHEDSIQFFHPSAIARDISEAEQDDEDVIGDDQL